MRPWCVAALLALLSNACRFTERGDAVTLTTERIVTADGSEQLRSAVADTGVGIPPANQTDLFEP